MKKEQSWIREILSARSGQLSSKRVCGVIGFLSCLVLGIVATLKSLTVPGFIDTVVIISAALMGVDSVTSIWKNNNIE